MRTLIKGGKLCLDDKVVQQDLLVDDEKIAAIGVIPKDVSVHKEIDATGCYVFPGLIDFHVHLDDQIGDYYIADTYETGSKIAIMNGITTLVSFITQHQGKSLSDSIQLAYQKAFKNSYCHYTWHLTPTTWDENSWQEIEDWFSKGFKTLKLYTTYKEAGIYSDYELIRSIIKRAKEHGVRTLIHCEDEAVLQKDSTTLSLSLGSAFSYTKFRSKKAEIIAIEKILSIAAELQAPVHIVHVSTVEGARLIHQAQLKGVSVTCETAPQYLFLNDTYLEEEDGYRYLCTPPLREEENRFILNLLADKQYFDIYATDHCPFTKQDKSALRSNILKVPKGMPGLGALLPMIYRLYANLEDHICLEISHRLSRNPAKLAGLYPRKGCLMTEADADLLILKEENISRDILPTLMDVYNPYENFKTNLDIKFVFQQGHCVVQDNEIVDTSKRGRCLCQI